MVWPFRKNKVEAMLLKSLDNDQWLITQGEGACSSHFYFHRNGIKLNMSLSPVWGWMMFEATVNGQGLEKYNSVKKKCAALIEKKFGIIDIPSMVEKELDSK